MSKVIFNTEIINYGMDAMDALEQNLLILFGQCVPEMLQDLVFIHNNNDLLENIEEGDILEVDGIRYSIKEVGEIASKNLAALGHCTFTFGENPDDGILPGSIYIDAPKTPAIHKGSIVRILKDKA